jgi:aspartate/methionine/tyrosine aminotransferase
MTKRQMRGRPIPPFYAGEIGRLATARALAGLEVITMHFGQPSAGAPAAALSRAHRMLDEDALGYYESVPLRERLSRHYLETYGLTVAPGRILLTSGASAGLVATFASLFRAGDQVAVVSPGYPAYRNTLTAMGLEPTELHCGQAENFVPSPQMLESLDPAPAGFILASPANPTGAMLDAGGMAAMTAICRERGIQLISDEIYHGITFDEPAVSALESDQDVIVINSFSKLYRMPGWRLGWLVAPPDWTAGISACLINMFLTPPALAQHAALAAMDDKEDLQNWVKIYRGNRDRLIAGLEAMGIPGIAAPSGAFYLYADIRHISRDSLAFCHRAVQEIGVAMAPGIDFDPEHGHQFLRFSFAVAPEQIERAIELLAAWLPAYRDEPGPPE